MGLPDDGCHQPKQLEPASSRSPKAGGLSRNRSWECEVQHSLYMWRSSSLANLRGSSFDFMKGVTTLAYSLQLWNRNATHTPTLAIEMSSAIETFPWWQHQKRQQKKWNVNDCTTLLAWAVFPNCRFSESFKTSSAPCAKGKGCAQRGMGADSTRGIIPLIHQTWQPLDSSPCQSRQRLEQDWMVPACLAF